ncbi:aminotransferase class I/II-fold pyridoxal phosphate-dependent enzyme [Devriesea agamarum]|uniref:aminotransferase class I/II-fold pyridoxal phosphate-dependent enzyme n=1 Tax=Devriesea agamarum TaxID=472569 RepID=UPI00071C84EE|nr:aminotransferase class I/II-fold pyridoxal phosphate-dependent enzyme [Devriesea agamarum]
MIDLTSASPLAPRPTVALEHPTYPNALELFSHIGARITALLPVRSRADLDIWQSALHHADLSYLIADFHNPTGISVPADLRPTLQSRNLLVVDESMVALVLGGACLPDAPPMGCSHPKAITIGSVSKNLWGGLRIGWLRASEKIIIRPA